MEQHTDLQEIIEYLNPAELDYQDWVNVGMALKHEGYSVDVGIHGVKMTGGITQENVRKSGILSMALILRLLPVQLFS